jgi:hypothetical protein
VKHGTRSATEGRPRLFDQESCTDLSASVTNRGMSVGEIRIMRMSCEVTKLSLICREAESVRECNLCRTDVEKFHLLFKASDPSGETCDDILAKP